MAVELATGYIDLVPSAKGIGERIAEELDLDRVATEQGKAAGDALSAGLLGQAKDTGKKLAAALGVAAVGALAIKSAADVEDANNTIIRSTGATGKAAEGLEQSFRNVVSGTGASFATVSDTLAQLYQRTGLQGQALEGLTSQVVSFNRQFKDAPITVDALTKATAGFNVPGENMGKVLDHLFIISQKTGEPLAQLLSDVQTGGPVLRQFGFSIEESATLLGRLNKAGIDSNQILPGLKKVFKDAADAGKDPRDALQQIATQLDGLVRAGDTIGARNLAVQVFGPRGAGLVDAALSGKLSLSDLLDQAKLTGDGILDTAGKTTTLAGTLGVLRNNATLAFAGFATPALQVANDTLKGLLPTVQDLSRDFTELPDGIKLGAVAAVGLAFSLGKIGEFITNAGPGLVSLGKLTADGFVLAAVKGSELIDTIKELTAAEALAAAGEFAAVAFPVAAAVAFGFAMHEILGGDLVGELTRDFKAGESAGKTWAQTIIAGAKATNAPITELKANLATLREEQARFKADPKAFGADSFDEAVRAGSRFRGEIQAIQGEIKGENQAQHDQAAQARETAAALDAYSAATEHGTNASSALAHLTDDAKKALSDLQSALIQSVGGEIGYQQAIIARDKANREAGNAVLRVLGAQQAYNQAVVDFGEGSQQALDAQDALNGAVQDSTSAQLDAQQASLNLAQATLGLDDNERKLLDAIGATGKTRKEQLSIIDAEIAREKASAAGHEAGADAIGPLLFALINLRLKIEDVPTAHDTTFTANADQLQAVIDTVNGLLAGVPGSRGVDIIGNALLPHAAGGVFTTPHIGLFAEAGPEAVLPLSDPTRSLQILSQTGLFDAMPPPKGAGGGSTTINYFGPLDDPVKRTREIVQDLHTVAVLGGWG